MVSMKTLLNEEQRKKSMSVASRFARNITLAIAICATSATLAGEWGTGLWGQMYWGSNSETAPIAAPNVNVNADVTDLLITLNNLLTGEDQGWTAITHFLVTCDGFEQVVISVDNPSLINLDPDTTYTCEIVAVNRVGQSPPSSFVATTGSLGGLPVWLLYQATQQA